MGWWWDEKQSQLLRAAVDRRCELDLSKLSRGKFFFNIERDCDGTTSVWNPYMNYWGLPPPESTLPSNL